MSNEDCFHLGAKALIRNAEGLLLLLTAAPSRVISHTHYDLPGGRLQKGEDEIKALKREVQEECGITSLINIKSILKALSPLRLPVGESDVGLIFSFYLCDIDPNQSITLSHEHISYDWHTPDKFASLVKSIYPEELINYIRSLPIHLS